MVLSEGGLHRLFYFSKKYILYYIILFIFQAGLFDKVVAELRKSPRCDFDVNIPDEVTGLTPLHFAAAAGAMVST